MTAPSTGGLPPPIVVSRRDAARLEALIDSPRWQNDATAEALLGELTRAEIVDEADMPSDVVGMNTRVECIDENTGERHELTLVFPNEADAGAAKVSVFAPVGSALLGLSVGQSIDWPTPQGRVLRLRVTGVTRADAD
ncbi:nucleoside diphosphate kinase regulator [Luteimonas wenzhouensis]|uniref:Nucleoside diphosphate kinase regulator n=1 Tax=Luteimonas wenzhouensis TaxID=2599615 RepID=A0A5C5U7B7_9GAMM|nr:nucleoside diphosphate kinase regulator [Luteimonas wenzhouensis]NLW96176.1 nucleoside diphosphate kinase regulator [Xanthomonadaceae bacterium]TWT21954.1 nucleoside diphosphate kinase regulator [Luteimonas wenzhouensis]